MAIGTCSRHGTYTIFEERDEEMQCPLCNDEIEPWPVQCRGEASDGK